MRGGQGVAWCAVAKLPSRKSSDVLIPIHRYSENGESRLLAYKSPSMVKTVGASATSVDLPRIPFLFLVFLVTQFHS